MRTHVQQDKHTPIVICKIPQVGLRTDQIGVYDNFVGGIAINGNSSDPDSYCVKAFNRSTCIAMSKQRGEAWPTFIDKLSDSGYGIHLYGKMHTGWGLDRYPGNINAFPFTNGASGSPKVIFSPCRHKTEFPAICTRYSFPSIFQILLAFNLSSPVRNCASGHADLAPSPTSKVSHNLT